MRRKIITFLLIIAMFLLQCSLFRSLSFFQTTPNLLLILTVSFGFMNGKRTGLWVGFFSGILIDIFSANPFGFHALLYMYVGYINGYFYKVYFDEDIKVPMFLVAVSDLAYCIVFYLFQFAFRNQFEFHAYLTKTMLPEIVFTVLLTIIMYRILFVLNRKLVEYEMEEQSPWLRR